MATESVFHVRLLSALVDYLSTHETPFDTPRDESTNGVGELFLPSSRRDGVVLHAVQSDVDPHSVDVIRWGQRRACEQCVSLFATANENDAFLFRRTDPTTDVSDFERQHYDLRTMTPERFCEAFICDVVSVQNGTDFPNGYDDFIVGRLRSFHTSISPRYESLIGDAFEENDRFRESFLAWARENDYPVEHPDVERTVRIGARQYAYLLLNRIVFSELVRDGDVETASGFSDGDIPVDVSIDAVNTIDGETNRGDTGAGFFSTIPQDDETVERVHGFAESIAQEPLSDIDTDVAGRIYQTLIPVEERKELGQFYTPDEIGRLLSRWAIRSPNDRVLDPASGSGSLAVEAYKRLDELGSRSHRELLRHITAVDINEFPLQLTALNLATRNVDEPTNERFAYHADFFDLDPGSLGTFDATVANPPYVRQEYLYPDRDHFRGHLRQFGTGSNVYYDGEKEIDGRSDLYCYFLTHVTSFLREGARLAWVVPTKWMAADYGPSLQGFLYDHYKVEAVVGFQSRIFEDALVDTVLLLLERTDDIAARRDTETNFVRINERMDPEDAIAVIDHTGNIPDGSHLKIRGRPNHRTIAVAQSHLEDHRGEKLHQYITAPSLYTAVLEHDATIELADVATITRGKKTGANPIFILDADEIRSRNVERRFLRPAVKSVREVDGYEHTADDAEKWMLAMADYTQNVVSSSDSVDTCDRTDSVTSALERDGYDVLSYLRWAGTQPSRTNVSVQTNDPWFDMGPLDGKTAPIICPQAMDTRRFFFRTDGDVIVSNRFLLVTPTTVETPLLLGLLNSSLSKIVIESHGRVTGGGAINLTSTDLRTFRVVDPEALTEGQAATVRDGFETLRSGDESGRTAIDDVVIDVLDLDVGPEELRTIARTLKLARRKKGHAVEPLLRELDALEGRIEMEFGD